MVEKHVTSLALSKRLKELGVKQDSEFYWCNIYGTDKWEIRPSKEMFGQEIDLGHDYQDEVSAFLASEVLEWLPEGTKIIKVVDHYICKNTRLNFHNGDKSSVECAGRALQYLLEQGLIKIPEESL